MTALDDKQRMMLKYQHHRVIQVFSSDSEDSDVEDRDRDPSQPRDNQALMEKQKELLKNPQETANLIYRKVIDS